MPFLHDQPTELRVLNATYSVGAGSKSRQILHDVSLSARNGELLAIMGPSGAGKTTLLQLMTQQLQGGKVGGDVMLNCEPLDFHAFRRHAAYVEQYDTHWGYLTCREIMHYASQLSIEDQPNQQRNRAERMMERLGLAECADTPAGNQLLKGLSGGQRKRLALGVALLKGPVLLFLDEPTSGLDAAGAASVTSYLKQLAKETNIIVIATIHQPSTAVFLSFDRVLFMANGREAYQGPTSDVASYCSFVGHPLPDMTNPADHFLELVNSEFVGREEVDKIVCKAIPGLRAPLENALPLGKALNYKATLPELQGSAEAGFPSLLSQVMLLLRRAGVNSVRDPTLYLGRMLAFLLANCFFAYIYKEARDPRQETADPKIRLLVWLVSVPSLFSVVSVTASNEEFRLVRAEVKNGLTNCLGYLIANGLSQIPYMIGLALFSLAIPWLIGFYPWDHFASALCIMAALLWAFECIGQLFGILFSSSMLGMLAMVGLWICCFLFMGVFLAESFIAWPFRILVDVSPLSWAVNGVVYAGINPTSFAGATLNADGGFSCPDAAVFQPCFGATGAQIISTFQNVMSSITPENKMLIDTGVLLAIGAVAKVLYVAVLLRKTRS